MEMNHCFRYGHLVYNNLLKTKKVTAILCLQFPDFRKSIVLLEGSRLRLFGLLVRPTCRRKLVLSIGEMAWTGGKNCRSYTCPSVTLSTTNFIGLTWNRIRASVLKGR